MRWHDAQRKLWHFRVDRHEKTALLMEPFVIWPTRTVFFPQCRMEPKAGATSMTMWEISQRLHPVRRSSHISMMNSISWFVKIMAYWEQRYSIPMMQAATWLLERHTHIQRERFQRYRHRIFLPIAPMAGRISYCPGMERVMPMMQAVIRLCCEEWHWPGEKDAV